MNKSKSNQNSDDKENFSIFKEVYNKMFEQLTFQEVLNLYNDYLTKTNSNIEKQLLKSLLNKYRYIKKIDPEIFYIYVELIDSIMYYNDALRICNEIKSKTLDKAQINTLNRIIKNKEINRGIDSANTEWLYKTLNGNEDDIFYRDDLKIYKSCPHCNKTFIGNKKTKYTICGYTNKGFDWKGCGRDWCFRCGKKLCKCWNIDQLFNINNRFHNNKCCKSYAHKLDENYKDQYCQCD